MKKMFCGAAVCLMMVSCSEGGDGSVTIRLPRDYKENTVVVSRILLDNMFNAQTQDEIVEVFDTLEVKDGVAKMSLDASGAARYNVIPPTMTRRQPEFYASPGEKLEITIQRFDPLEYTAHGSELMDDYTALISTVWPIQEEYVEMINSEDIIDPAKAKAALDRYDDAVKKFVADNPKSQIVPFAIVDLSGDDFKVIYDNMTQEARASVLMPLADQYNAQVEEMQRERAAEQARMDEFASGRITAPGFTLPDLAGKKVSLSDFRGKWVVLDFWGSWCGWCVKGFPALKEAYKEYGDKIVVIGIDCNESEADWKAGVKAHDLPWLNLYNGDDTALYEAYGIEGFPTKVIINPEGKIVDLTTGEDPAFFDRLASFVK